MINNKTITRAEAIYELFQLSSHVLESEMDFEIVLKGHLLIENSIRQLIVLEFKKPEFLDLDRSSFPWKINLLVATGVVDKDDSTPYMKLNKLRNKFAHSIDFKINDDEIEKLFDSLSKAQHEAYDRLIDESGKEKNLFLKNIIFVLWMNLFLQSVPPEKESDIQFWRDFDFPQVIDELKEQDFKNQKIE